MCLNGDGHQAYDVKTMSLTGRLMLYIVMYIMHGATRTQVYLTADQRRRIDVRTRRDGTTLAHIIREALDEYLVAEPVDTDRALAETFGSLPELEVPPRDEWNRG